MSDPSESLLEHYMGLIREKLPVVDRTLSDYGHLTIDEYLDVITKTPSASYQPSDDFAEAVYDCAAPLLGEETALLVRNELRQSPVVLTANHHGVDYFAQSVQGTMIFSQRKLPSGKKAKTIPVLACGNIPLNNLTYPRGIMAYGQNSTVLKIPIFPKRKQAQLVFRMSAINSEDLSRACKYVSRMVADGEVDIETGQAIRRIILEHYSNEDVVSLGSYSDQATVVNSRLWDSAFKKDFSSRLVYIQQEDVVNRLLLKDLRNPESLASIVIFNKSIRDNVIEDLNGCPGCWNLDQLNDRLNGNDTPTGSGGSAGSFMFWLLDEKGRRVPLNFHEEAGIAFLHGVSDAGGFHTVKFDVDTIQGLIENKTLIPTNFLAFLIMSFSRGVNCLGGYYQSYYLTLYKEKLLAVFENSADYSEVVKFLLEVPSDSYLSGMQLYSKGKDCEEIYSLNGMVEFYKKSLQGESVHKGYLDITVSDAHIASIMDTVFDVCKGSLSEDVYSELKFSLDDYFCSARN
ncbi:hypothetical protein [Marinobacterium jannaschii]|uniref:hypothetical protein n=1 Tax=Marinobacterium jannaschii TaxID=64970 RepID=UPI000AB533F5|nr:hypothetical protein [Marinobacterium jannaschii]